MDGCERNMISEKKYLVRAGKREYRQRVKKKKKNYRDKGRRKQYMTVQRTAIKEKGSLNDDRKEKGDENNVKIKICMREKGHKKGCKEREQNE